MLFLSSVKDAAAAIAAVAESSSAGCPGPRRDQPREFLPPGSVIISLKYLTRRSRWIIERQHHTARFARPARASIGERLLMRAYLQMPSNNLRNEIAKDIAQRLINELCC